MLTPPRFIAIDDEQEHLDLITKTFKLLGSTCLGIHYDNNDVQEESLDSKFFNGVRGLFIDLHLEANTSSTDNKQHYGVIVRILEKVIQNTNGPFILILWTRYATELDGLKKYIDGAIDSNKKYAIPVDIKSLDKTLFINNNTSNFETLKIQVKECFDSVPQLAALFDWESRVIKALNQSLIELMSLVPASKQTIKEYPSEINRVLTTIMEASVGKNFTRDPFSVLNMSLAPILLDKILNNNETNTNKSVYDQLTTQLAPSSKITDLKDIGKYNKMLHLALINSKEIKQTDLGAVIKIKNWSDEFSDENYGLTINAIESCFSISNDDKQNTPILIRIGAPCDYAQQNVGLLQYCLGYKVTGPIKKGLANKKYLWISPIFFDPNELSNEPFHFIINLRFISTYTPKKIENHTVIYKIRDQLLNHLISNAASYTSRIGIVSLRPSK